MKNWLATIPDGKPPTNEKTEGKEEVYHPVHRLQVLNCELLQKSSALFARVIKIRKIMWLDIYHDWEK